MARIDTKLRIDDAGCIDDKQHEWHLQIDGVRGRYGSYSYSGRASVTVRLFCATCKSNWISVERQSKLGEFLSRWRTEYLCRRERRVADLDYAERLQIEEVYRARMEREWVEPPPPDSLEWLDLPTDSRA